jgi:A/G-specific adenine glycosylase
VLAWGLPRLRDLPWRYTRDPWAVLVSEVMLQQTQAARVVPKWHAFLEGFPTAGACAAASLGDVLRLWQGLGYPRRAQNLHATAIEVERLGAFPSTLAGLLALPGVGAYTARAVLAFAFEDDVAVVDTNIARVYARVLGTRLSLGEVQTAADEQLPLGQAWEWNQCLMDLGAVLCRPMNPACFECPVVEQCRYRGLGDDPALGSAGVSRTQARFEGSDRQARGRLLKALSAAPVAESETADVMAVQPERAARLVQALAAEGLVVVEPVIDGSRLRLP